MEDSKRKKALGIRNNVALCDILLVLTGGIADIIVVCLIGNIPSGYVAILIYCTIGNALMLTIANMPKLSIRRLFQWKTKQKTY